MGPRDEWKKTTDPGYDPELLEMIAKYVAVDPRNRPTISELLETLSYWVSQKTAQYYINMRLPEFSRETNEYMERLVQMYIYEPNTMP